MASAISDSETSAQLQTTRLRGPLKTRWRAGGRQEQPAPQALGLRAVQHQFPEPGAGGRFSEEQQPGEPVLLHQSPLDDAASRVRASRYSTL